jgi:Asp/Glu/hydantoin racemase
MDLAKQRVTIPLLKPDEAMIAAALETGRRIGIVATMPAAAPTQAEQLEAAAAEQGKTIRVETAVAADALAALNAGDTAGHDRLVAEAVARLAETVDAICLAQFSMARARAAAQARVPVPVLTSPAAAVARLKAMLTVKRET